MDKNAILLATDIEKLSKYAFMAPAFAHDSANYLTVLEGISCSLRRSLQPQSDLDTERYLDLLDDQINLLSNFFRSFLGRESDHRNEPVGELVTDYAHIFGACSNERQVRFEITDLELFNSMEVPKLDFSRVIVNLLQNACTACMLLPEEQRIVSIVAYDNDGMALEIKNPVNSEDTPQINKKSYGLKLIRSTCEDMNIEFSHRVESKHFVSKLKFPSSWMTDNP